MASQPGQDWSGGELASRLGVKPPNLLTQLAEWTRLGFLSKTGRGRYALPGPAARAPPPTAPDRNPEIATTLLTSRQHGLTTRHWGRDGPAGLPLDPVDHCGPWGQEERAGPGLPRAARRAKPRSGGRARAPEPAGNP